MANHDYVIANQTGANTRSDLNNLFQAIVSQNSSASEPTTKYAYMLWADTTNGVLKVRNSANNAWLSVYSLTTGANTGSLPLVGGTMTGNISMTGSGTVDGRDVSADGTQLDSNTTAIALNTAKVTNATHTGDVTGDTVLTIAAGAVDIAMLSATGTAGAGNFLRGDNSWAVVDGLPSQTGNAGEFLQTDGTTATWEAVPSGNITTNGLYEMANTISANYSVASGNNAISAGAITINSGVSVTVPSGSTWVIA